MSLPLLAVAESPVNLRGDEGPLTELEPQAVEWLTDDLLLVTDSHRNNLQIFDTSGRRFRLFDAASNSAPAHFVGLDRITEDEFLILGSHYHEKNHPRYREQRSRLHKFQLDLETETLSLDDFKENISPLESLRMTRMWGSTPLRQLEFCGIALNTRKDIAWFGLTQPKSEKGNLSLLRCSLKGLLEVDEDLEFTEVDTGFKLPIEERCQLPMYLTDLEVLDDGSLLLLLTADDIEGKRFCTNSLYRWVPGGKATLVKKDIAPENRATGLALKSLGKGLYRVALVCDNVTSETKVPPRLVILEQPVKAH
jgi:hypothetical protein